MKLTSKHFCQLLPSYESFTFQVHNKSSKEGESLAHKAPVITKSIKQVARYTHKLEKRIPVRYNTVHNVKQYNVVQYSTVQFISVQCSATCSIVQCSTVYFSLVQ